MQRNRGFTGDVATQYDVWLRRPLFAPNAVELEKRVNPVSRILDLACGPCVVAERLAMKRTLKATSDAPKIIGCDRNLDMMRPAQKRAEFFEIPILTADASALPFASSSFDAVTCQFGWMFFDDKVAVMREVSRILRPGGQLVLSTWASMGENSWIERARSAVASVFPNVVPDYYDGPFVMADAANTHKHLVEAGYAGIKIEAIELPLVFSSAFAFATGFTRSNAAVMNLAAEYSIDPAIVVDQIQAAASAAFGDSPMRATMRSNIFSAVKPESKLG